MKWLLLAPALAMLGCSNETALLAPGSSPPAPLANSPTNVVNLLAWSYDNRSVSAYRTVFASDFELVCTASDSAGGIFRDDPWTREDEIEWFSHLVRFGDGVTRISLLHGRPVVQLDPRPGMNPDVHRKVLMTYHLEVALAAGPLLEFGGDAAFFVVRGDSASIPPDLGRAPRPDQWYIERWEDLSATASTPSMAGVRTSARLATTSAFDSSWCALRHDTLGS